MHSFTCVVHSIALRWKPGNDELEKMTDLDFYFLVQVYSFRCHGLVGLFVDCDME
jgi:hypothetical protein